MTTRYRNPTPADVAARRAQLAPLDGWNERAFCQVVAWAGLPARYLDLLARPEYERGGVKHPLVLVLRPFAWPFLAAGATPPEPEVDYVSLKAGQTIELMYNGVRSVIKEVGVFSPKMKPQDELGPGQRRGAEEDAHVLAKPAA